MQLIIPPPDIALAGLRALKTIGTVDGPLRPLERRFLDSVQAQLLTTAIDIDQLRPITPRQLAAAVQQAEPRERILCGCIIMALIDGEASEAEGVVLEQFALALGVSSHALKDVQRIIHHNLTAARIDMTRRSFIGQRARSYLADQGARGLVRVVRSMLGIEDRPLALRYQALGTAPRGTLGREYYEFIRRNHFLLPGEKGAAPEIVVFHDCLHVLAGYDTTSIEETQIASFQAGMLKKDPIFGLLFMLAQFHLGIRMTPVTGAEKLVADPKLMLEAFVRGTKVTRDLCVDWTPQHDFERGVDELRREYNIEPRPGAPSAGVVADSQRVSA